MSKITTGSIGDEAGEEMQVDVELEQALQVELDAALSDVMEADEAVAESDLLLNPTEGTDQTTDSENDGVGSSAPEDKKQSKSRTKKGTAKSGKKAKETDEEEPQAVENDAPELELELESGETDPLTLEPLAEAILPEGLAEEEGAPPWDIGADASGLSGLVGESIVDTTVLLDDDELSDEPQSVPSNEDDAEAAERESTTVIERRRVRSRPPDALAISRREGVQRPDEQDDINWHEIKSAYLARRRLTGIFSGIERLPNGNIITIVEYKGFRVVIPARHMLVQTNRTGLSGEEWQDRQGRLLNRMLGAEIDFIVLGIENDSRSIVASRTAAMKRKREFFYQTPDESGQYRIYEGRDVEARIIAVAYKAIRVEVFGIEASIKAEDLSWGWIGDVHEDYRVGDKILVRVKQIYNQEDPDNIGVRVDVKSLTENTVLEALNRCQLQARYSGTVTDIHRGAVYVHLAMGVNVICHLNMDRRLPAKGDTVLVVVRRKDEERGVALGMITRIITQAV